MEENGFVKYNTVKEILENAGFFGTTCHRDKDGKKILYRFASVKWNKTAVEVTTLKLEPDNINTKKIVINININGTDIEGLGTFREYIESLGKPYAKKGK